jgi:uncharacterized protein
MNVNKELVQYVEREIFPIYERDVSCHGLEHVREVIAKSLKFIEQVKGEAVDADMVYTVAAYHDIGILQDRAAHHQIGARILRDDKGLDRFFTSGQKQIMAQAIEDHRASMKGAPRNIYGKIVSTADRNWGMDGVMGVMYRFRLRYNPEFTLDEIVEDSYKHVVEKFGAGGYARDKTYFKDDDYEKFCRDLDKLIKDKAKFRQEFLRANKLFDKNDKK